MREGVAHLEPGILPIRGQGRRFSRRASPFRTGPSKHPAKQDPSLADARASHKPSSRWARYAIPTRVGFGAFGLRAGSVACIPDFRAKQSLFHVQMPQVGDLGVQIVAPKSMTACA